MRDLQRFTRTGAAALAATLWLIPGRVTSAETPYTATGWVSDVPVIPIVCTNGIGQVFLRGNAQLLRVIGSDPRLTGQRVVFANGAYQADGSALIHGTACQEVGTFDAANKFTPTTGLWEISYRGVMRADCSLELTLVGQGLGGSVDGLRIEETMTRAPASGPIDPAIPYLYSGTIRPQPATAVSSVLLDDFDTLPLTGWSAVGTGQRTLVPAAGQLTVRGYWPGVTTTRIELTYVWAQVGRSWSLSEGQTLEWRVDLVGMNDHADAAALANANASTGTCYLFYKWRNHVGIGKWVAGQVALLSFESAPVKNNNVVLAFALTRVGPNVQLAARVLDKDNQDAVLYEGSVVDTPGADPTVTMLQVASLSGMTLAVGPDVSGAPYMSGNVLFLESWQYNDGTRPAAEVTYDNLEERRGTPAASTPPVMAIESTVRLTWLAPYGADYAVECGPTPEGPWSPLGRRVTDGEFSGLKQVAVDPRQAAQFYRLVEAP